MTWKKELQNSFCTADQLCNFLNLPKSEIPEYQSLLEKFPMMITPYYLSLVDKNDPDDPIAKMCIPSFDELDPAGSFDTSGEESNTKQTGMQHKYPQTALIMSTNVCAMYCRHCFRKRLIGLTDDELLEQLGTAAAYVKKHPEINNVLISGGDALMNPNHILHSYLKEFSSHENLDYIRFGTRIPVTLPERIYADDELLDMLSVYAKKKTLYLITQFNHPREITPQAIRAVQCCLDRGITVCNQTVLLKGVNDSADVLKKLFSRLTEISVTPYYLFQCRPVTGVKNRFQVPLQKAVAIVDTAKAALNGPAKSFRYVMSHPLGKIEILGLLNKSQMLFKFHQHKHHSDNARLFTAELKETATWLNGELKPV